MIADHLTIAEMALRYGVTHRTLRFYESKNLLGPIRQGTIRYYTPRDRVRIEVILKAKGFGFSLADIIELIEDQKTKSAIAAEEIVDLLSKDEIFAKLRALEDRRAGIVQAIQELEDALTKRSTNRAREKVDG